MLENEHRDSVKMFNAVKYIVTHRATFKFAARRVVRATYEKICCLYKADHRTGKVAGPERWGIGRKGRDY
jgi:hypothetical protein